MQLKQDPHVAQRSNGTRRRHGKSGSAMTRASFVNLAQSRRFSAYFFIWKFKHVLFNRLPRRQPTAAPALHRASRRNRQVLEIIDASECPARRRTTFQAWALLGVSISPLRGFEPCFALHTHKLSLPSIAENQQLLGQVSHAAAAAATAADFDRRRSARLGCRAVQLDVVPQHIGPQPHCAWPHRDPLEHAHAPGAMSSPAKWQNNNKKKKKKKMMMKIKMIMKTMKNRAGSRNVTLSDLSLMSL